MSETKTTASWNANQPKPDQQGLAISLHCPYCDTVRVFEITTNLKAVAQRNASWLGWDCTCEICGYESRVRIGWAGTDTPGYSYRPFDEQATGKFVDDRGLAKPSFALCEIEGATN